MLGLEYVRPLEDDWRATLDGIAQARRWPTTHDARLAACVADLSAAYNDATRARAPVKQAGPARLSFSFVRDVPKGAAAVREILAARAIRGIDDEGHVVRVLDVGAGLGAMTWGLARALDAAGCRARIDATWMDADAEALALGRAILAARGSRAGAVELDVRTEVAGIDSLGPSSREPGGRARSLFDLVMVGQLLSELDVGEPDDVRVERHVRKLGTVLEAHVAPTGFLVVVEPALRDRTRHLHRVRDAWLASDSRSPDSAVFAPCLHGGPCPALTQAGDWCHEDLPIDLPPWLVAIARGAGLRFQGLTFSYLVLRRDGPGLSALLAPHVGAAAARLRVVSNRKATKGKTEAFLCGDFQRGGAASPSTGGVTASHRHRDPNSTRACVARLNRDADTGNRAWDAMARGDVVAMNPPPEPGAGGGARLRRTSAVEVVGGAIPATSGIGGAPAGGVARGPGSSEGGETR